MGKKWNKPEIQMYNLFQDTENLGNVDFIDVTFKLSNEYYSPSMKPNDNLLYVNTSSNHPLQITKILSSLINERLSKNSFNETIFNNSKLDFVIAPKDSSYKSVDLKFIKIQDKKNRERNCNTT